MKHAVTRSIYDYWHQKRGTRIAPERAEIEPTDIRDYLGDTFILQVDEDSYSFRLAGSRVCSLYCRELKSRDFLGFWQGENATTMAALLASVTRNGAAAIIGVTATNSRGREINLELQLLPVKQGGDGYARILGTLVPIEDHYWVGIHPLEKHQISSMRLDWPGETPSLGGPKLAKPRTVPGFSEFTIRHKQGAGIRQVAHLTVYDGGRN